MLLILIALLAQAQPVFTEDFPSGSQVDLNQGFYVCETPNPRDTVDQLVEILDGNVRRDRADSLGCPFVFQPEHPHRVTVIDHTADICLDVRSSSYNAYCGREAHQLTIQDGSKRETVIWISLDVDYDEN